ncbi:putative major facilitator superfamily, MFS transporter superfamily [Septoria linicola]|nr:putative major facilitator superfamily, MFS transporter superfamily [Septoria linicola]
MQSILQFKRFRKTVEAQLERDRAKAEAFTQHGSRNEPQAQSSGSTSSHESKQDYEKDVERGDFAVAGGILEPHGRQDARHELSDLGAREKQEEEHEEPAESPGVDEEEEDDDDDDFELRANRTLSRISTQRSAGHALGAVLTGVEVRRRTTKEGGDGNVFVVGYEGPDDPNDPHNWPFWKRVRCTFLVAAIGCVVGLASAIDSSALPQAAEEFGVSEVVESMATGLFLIGFGLGALFAGPISETVGRNPVYIVTLAIYMIWIMASALAPNIGAQLAFRFLAGLFGSTPLTCAGGSISDLWNPLERVFSFPVFANAAFTGPLLGPIIGGYIAQSSQLSWRWTEWITLIISGLVLCLVIAFQPETYPQTLLKWKAQHLRQTTGDNRYRAAIEVRDDSLYVRLKRALYRPFLLTFQEPIIILLALYLTVIYIILFTFLDGFTYIFQDTYGISQGLTGICFFGIVIGLFGASALVPLIYNWAKRDLAKIQAQGGTRLPPEFRLWYSMLGGSLAIPISIFWMAWTSSPDISIWSPLAASVLFGYGILCVFITCYQYIIDSYETFAASALASITLIRYVAAGGMTIVGVPFYANLGVHYTLTILACLAVPLVPVPYIFYHYGPWIRSKSKYAINESVGGS